MVSYEDYAEAKAFVFNKEGDADKYAGLIEKPDRYQENVGAHLTEIYEQMGRDGVHIYNISKYGPQYLIYDNNPGEELAELAPMTEENTGSDTGKVSFFKALVQFFRSLIQYLKKMIGQSNAA